MNSETLKYSVPYDEVLSGSISLLEEINNLSDDDNFLVDFMDTSTYSSNNVNTLKVKQELKIEPKIEAKIESKVEPNTESNTEQKIEIKEIKAEAKEVKIEPIIETKSEQERERITNGDALRRLQLTRTKRSNEDYNSTAELLHQQMRKKRYSNSPTRFNNTSNGTSNSNHDNPAQPSPYNEFNITTGENQEIAYIPPSPINNNNISRNNNNNEENDNESFSGYKPPMNETPIPPRNDEIVLVNNLKYRILRPVGEGGSGKVFMAFSLKYRDIFALKWIMLRDEIDRQNVKNEIKILKTLRKSRYVINLCDYELTSKVGYLIMEYGSSSFSEIIHSKSFEGWDNLFFRYYWKQMLEAVNEIHHYGIIHADLKPANFVLVKSRLKLIDFGIADKIPDHTTNIGRLNQVGTANFMAPETLIDTNIIQGNQSGYKQGRPSDIWSLGCILYQMIYSKPPFFNIPRAALANAILNPQHKILIPENAKYGSETVRVPNDLRELLDLCLKRNPDMRPTMKELLAHPSINSP